MQPRAPCITDASGVRNEAPKGVQIATNPRESDGGIDAGEAGGGEPPRRLSGGRCGGSRGQSCAARCRRRRRCCPHWCGQQCASRCGAKCGPAPQERPHECGEHCAGWCASRCAAKPATGDAPGDARVHRAEPEAMPAAGAAGQGERGEVCDERCAKRRREETAAVTRPLPLNTAPPATARTQPRRCRPGTRR